MIVIHATLFGIYLDLVLIINTIFSGECLKNNIPSNELPKLCVIDLKSVEIAIRTIVAKKIFVWIHNCAKNT